MCSSVDGVWIRDVALEESNVRTYCLVSHA
jgi:hypothetical protein